MDNCLKEFEKLFLDNALLKVQTKHKQIKPEMEEMVANLQEIIEEHIQDNFGDNSCK